MTSARWTDPANKLFPYQVGFVAPPADFEASATDFLRLAPANVGVIQRMLHVPDYQRTLDERARNFHLIEEAAECLAAAGAQVIGQAGTNWVHCMGTGVAEIRAHCDRLAERFGSPYFIGGLSILDGLRELGVERIAVNGGYARPQWKEGFRRFLAEGGFDVLYHGTFLDQGLYRSQAEVEAQWWIFPEAIALESMRRVAEAAPQAEAVVLTGIPSFRPREGIPLRPAALAGAIEAEIAKPLVATDAALFWALFKHLGLAPARGHGRLLDRLARTPSANHVTTIEDDRGCPKYPTLS